MAAMSAVGRMRSAMLRRVATKTTLSAGYPGLMRRLLSTVVRLAVIVGLLAVMRELLLDRSPQRALQGDEPVIGSLDTWPAVPRKP